jgi:adenylate kinase family enzyme
MPTSIVQPKRPRFKPGPPAVPCHDMERIVILGPGGAGKSELARGISHRTGLPVVHLDVLFWRQGWAPAPRETALMDLDAAIARERWILDGNFLDAGRARFDRAETVVFLDLSRARCLWRVLKRLLRDRRRRRPDLPEGCFEGFDLEFLRWIWRYPRTDRPQVLRLLAGLNPRVDVRRLRSPADIRRYLATL